VKRAMILIGLLAGPVLAQDVDGAAALRETASKHWRAGNFAEGVKALKEAVALYVGTDPLPVAPWAQTMRMLTWQQMKAGDLDGARATFHSLVETLAKKPGLSGVPQEAIVSWRALREAAASGNDFDKGIALYDEAVATFDKAKDQGFVAQVRHEAGNYAGQHSKYDRADAYLTSAAADRARIGDHLGYAWSTNQLAYWRIQAGKLDGAREPIREAYQTMRARRLVVPQASIEGNLRTLLKALAQRPDRKDPAVREWLTELATDATNFPRVIPRTYLIRILLEWSKSGTDPLSSARLVLKGIGDLTPEERVDVTLQCSLAAVQQSDAALAREWLTAITVPDRPDWAHLASRFHGVSALAAENAESLGAHAAAALDGFDKLGDVGGARATAALLKESAPFPLSEATAARVEKSLRAGLPGGAGGSASGGRPGDTSKMDWHDPLFAVTLVGEKITVQDLAGGTDRSFDAAWKPRNIGFNGLSLTLFGRYVVIQALNYGRGATASGARGATTLDKLGAYRPLREGYVLHVLRNGALRYARMADDNNGK